MTLTESLADLWETVRPGSVAARHWRDIVNRERQDALDAVPDVAAAWGVINAVPEKCKHDPQGCAWETCAPCLATKLARVLPEVVE